MPTITVRRGLLALVCVLVAAPVAIMAASPPTFAAGPCCRVGIGNMPGQFSAGGDPRPFTLNVVNRSGQNLRYLDVTFALQGNGLVGDLVHLQRLRARGGPHNVGTFTQRGVHAGAVVAHDQVDLGSPALPPGGSANITYQLSFRRNTPSGGLSLSVQVQPRRSNGDSASSAGPYQSTILAAGQQVQTQPTPTPTPAASDTPTPAASNAVPAGPSDQQSVAGAGSSGGGGSLTWLAYTLGALLLLGGIGLVGMLAWRRGPGGIEEDDPQPYGQPTYPTQQFGVNPTAVVDNNARPWAASDTAQTQVAPPHAAPTRVTPTVFPTRGRHSAPPSQFPAPSDPFADPNQTRIDPLAGR